MLTDEIKYQAVALKNLGLSVSKISKELNVAYVTIRDFLIKFNDTGSIAHGLD